MVKRWVDRTSGRKPYQGLHVRAFFPVMGKAIAQVCLIALAELVIKPCGCQERARSEGEQSAVGFKLINKKLISGTSCGIDSKDVGENAGASRSSNSRLGGKAGHGSCTQGREPRDDRLLSLSWTKYVRISE